MSVSAPTSGWVAGGAECGVGRGGVWGRGEVGCGPWVGRERGGVWCGAGRCMGAGRSGVWAVGWLWAGVVWCGAGRSSMGVWWGGAGCGWRLATGPPVACHYYAGPRQSDGRNGRER